MTPPEPPQVLLRLGGICKTYSVGPVETEVLRGVSLEVVRGDLLSLMGPSGSGKSTLMNILGLLDRPTSGTYSFAGREVTEIDDDGLSDIRNFKIGFVFQSFNLLPRLNALDNVGLPLIYRGLADVDIRERADASLHQLGMSDWAARKPNELSGGQQQRVAIARALVGEPDLILADEPTGALDPRTGQEIMELLLHLNAEQGLTVVVVTHDLSVDRLCARRTRIRDGMLHEQDVDRND